jgi:uncharacterized protein YaaQ
MDVDKLMLAIVQPDDADAATNALIAAGLSVTQISSLGGFLGIHNVTLLIGLASNEVEHALDILRTQCRKRSVPLDATALANASPQSVSMQSTLVDIGSAVVFIFPIVRYAHLESNQPLVDVKHALIEPGSMQLVFVIVPENESGKLLERLTDWSYHATLISTTGGFLKQGNATLLMGVRSERVDSILEQIHPVTDLNVGKDSAATVFVLEMIRQERL